MSLAVVSSTAIADPKPSAIDIKPIRAHLHAFEDAAGGVYVVQMSFDNPDDAHVDGLWFGTRKSKQLYEQTVSGGSLDTTVHPPSWEIDVCAPRVSSRNGQCDQPAVRGASGRRRSSAPRAGWLCGKRAPMPRRNDLESILIIGSGPIVIGQACEFDYSGTQACKALREEGLRVVLVNSNPATIMTDPELADATYVEPLTVEVLDKVLAREKPDAILPTLGGQTGLNLAMARAQGRRAREARRRAARRDGRRRSRWPRIASCSSRRWRASASRARARGSSHSVEEARAIVDEIGFPAILRPSFTLGGSGGGIAYNRRELRPHGRSSGSTSRRVHSILVEESVLGWKEFELEVMRDAQGQRGHRLLDREPRSDGRAHRRLDHRRAGDDADRQGVPAHARRRRSRSCARSASTTGGSNVQFAVDPKTGRMVVDRDEPARVAQLGAGVEGDRASRSRRSPRSSRSATRSTSSTTTSRASRRRRSSRRSTTWS